MNKHNTEDTPSAEEENLAETKTRLEKVFEHSQETTENSTAEAESDDYSHTAPIATLLDRANEYINSFLQVIRDERTFEGARDDIENLMEIAAEGEELLETIDYSEFLETVELDELPEVVDIGALPEAVSEKNAKKAIQYRKLITLVDFGTLWETVDLSAFRQNKRELEDAIDDLTDTHDEGADMKVWREFKELLDSITEDGSDTGGGPSGDPGDTADVSIRSDEVSVPSEALQASIQAEVDDAVGEFRESVLEARRNVKAARTELDERTGSVDQPSSRNPTAYSTLESSKKTRKGFFQYSTVPQQPRHTSAPTRQRIYGPRFESAIEEDEDP